MMHFYRFNHPTHQSSCFAYIYQHNAVYTVIQKSIKSHFAADNFNFH